MNSYMNDWKQILVSLNLGSVVVGAVPHDVPILMRGVVFLLRRTFLVNSMVCAPVTVIKEGCHVTGNTDFV